ncbi:MAG: hypothetical protein ABIJ25_09685 [Pseudomonadota bacterium]
MEPRLLFWWRWLVVATCAVLVFGLSMVLLPEPTQKLFNYIYLSSPQGSTTFGESAIAYITFISAVLGAVMFGWSVALLYVLFGPFRRRQIEGWRTLAVSLVAWFIPDTAFSLWSGFWQNAVLNTIMLVLFLIPLAATYEMFKTPPRRTTGCTGSPINQAPGEP